MYKKIQFLFKVFFSLWKLQFFFEENNTHTYAIYIWTFISTFNAQHGCKHTKKYICYTYMFQKVNNSVLKSNNLIILFRKCFFHFNLFIYIVRKYRCEVYSMCVCVCVFRAVYAKSRILNNVKDLCKIQRRSTIRGKNDIQSQCKSQCNTIRILKHIK